MSRSEEPSRSAAPWLTGGGEMGRLMRSMDWAGTPLGPVDSWPQSLRSAISILLPSKAQIVMFWGPEFIALYNDAYVPTIGSKHPRALGRPARENWSELWDILEPLLLRVVRTGEAFHAGDYPFFIERHGYFEEVYFDVSYDPIRGESGDVAGVFCIVNETTRRVLGERRLRTLRDLGSKTASGGSVSAVCKSAIEVMAGNPYDVPFSLLYLPEPAGERATLVAATGGLTAAQSAAESWPLARATTSGCEEIRDLDARFGNLPGGPWKESPRSALVLALPAPAREQPLGLLVVGISPRRQLDEEYGAFLKLLAGQIATAIASANAYEQERERARKLAELDELKSQFFANVSHELRTPLALILGPTERLLQSAALAGSEKADLEVVRRNARTLLRHVNDLLDVSKLEAGKVQLECAEVDLLRLLKRTASHFEALAQERRIAFSVDAPDRLPAEADAGKLERVLLNLISNAFKFTPDGGHVRCSLRESGRRARFEIADSGPGIPAQKRAAAFERFVQLEGGPARSFGGTGLGLAIARDFIELHGGAIAIGDAPEGGALLALDIPLQAPAGAARVLAPKENESLAEQMVEELRPSQHPAAPEPGTGEAPVVLVVEDNAEMNAFVSQCLSGEFRTASAFDGEEGLAKALALRPDLILSDVMMPRMSGDQLVREVRARRELEATPILLLTAKADDELRVRLLREGAQDYVMKPFATAELLARARNLVATKRAREVLQLELASQSGDLEGLARELAHSRRLLQTALDSKEAARELAERASEMKTQFLSLVSHELRTPVASILLQVDSLIRYGGAPPQERLSAMRGTTRRLAELVDSLLDYAAIESGRLRVEPREFDVAELAGQVVEDLQPQARQKALKLRLRSEGQLPRLESDPRLLRLVLSSLASNAIKFTDRGAVEVLLSWTDGTHVLAVKDTGPGIPAEDQQRIFEPFEQLQPLRRKHQPGLGLGLALVQRLATALGGEIRVQSEPSKGSTFEVRLPTTAARATVAWMKRGAKRSRP